MSSSGSLGQLLGPIQKEIDLFEQRLDEILQADVEMVHDVARYMATLKGKRLRPALIVLCARATGHWDDRVIDAGVSVEMVHAVTLNHDDVIDPADTRTKLIRALETLQNKRDSMPPKKHGNIPL